MNCLLRKFILKQLNNLLETYRDDVEQTREKVKVWLGRADSVSGFLKGLDEKLADNNITDDEVKSVVEEFKQIIEEWRG